MRGAILAAIAVLVMGVPAPAAAQLEEISNREAVNTLKAALDKGARAAVDQLGRENGYFGDARVKIPLPESLARAERNLRRLGMGRYADELASSTPSSRPESRESSASTGRRRS